MEPIVALRKEWSESSPARKDPAGIGAEWKVSPTRDRSGQSEHTMESGETARPANDDADLIE